MPLIGVLQTLVDGQVITAAQHNSNYTDIKNAFNTSAVLTDVAKTITVSHTWSASQTFAAGFAFGGSLIPSADGTLDLGSAAFRVRDGFFSRHLVVGGTPRAWGVNFTGRLDLGSSGALVAGNAVFGTQLINNAYYDDTNWRYATVGEALQLATSSGQLLVSTAPSGAAAAIITLTERLRLTNTGILAFGTTVTTSAATGEVVLANNKRLRGVNAAGTDTLKIITLSNDNNVWVADGGTSVVALGNPATLASAAAGDVVLANNKSYRGVTAAGTGTVNLIKFDASNQVIVGESGNAIGFGAPASFVSAAGGDVVLANTRALRGVNPAGTDTRFLIGMDSSDRVQLGPLGGTTDILWGRAPYAMGNGAAITLGLAAGGAGIGPAAAAQVGWLRAITSAGTVAYFPYWT